MKAIVIFMKLLFYKPKPGFIFQFLSNYNEYNKYDFIIWLTKVYFRNLSSFTYSDQFGSVPQEMKNSSQFTTLNK